EQEGIAGRTQNPRLCIPIPFPDMNIAKAPHIVLFLFFLLVPMLPASPQGFDARNQAMGGARVASSHYSNAGASNPALLTHFKEGDSFAFIFPSAGLLLNDKDELVKALDDFVDEVD